MADEKALKILKQSVTKWNYWRENDQYADYFPINLTDAELTEVDLKEANLRKVDLGGSNLRKANLRGADLFQANLSFSETTFAYTNLSEADLSVADLTKTNLRDADLTKANLDRADLTKANLKGANLEKANLQEANLMGANLQETNLQGANLRGVYLKGFDLDLNLNIANFRGADLQKANLSETVFGEANFQGVNLQGADLLRANLQGTDLSGVNLSGTLLCQCNALNANFTNATLTGACIEDWNINAETNFENVICDYIYYKYDWQTEKYSDRRPHDENKIFNPGDFQRLIETARETVDLIFSDGIDWKAFLESFHGLQVESENGELAIAGILKKRDGTFVIQIDAPQSIDKASLENHFYEIYEQRLALIEQTYQAQLASKDQEITKRDQELLQLYREKSTDMTEIAKQLAANQQFINIEAKAMSYGNINQEGNFGVGVNLGKIEGNAKISGILNEAQQQNLTEAITEVQSILAQLSQTYPNNPTTQGIKTIEAIEQRLPLKQKLLKAAEQGGLAALEKALDNPAGAFVVTAIKTWREN